MRIRTGYSFRSATGKLPDVIARLKEIGETVAVMTDTSSTFGWVRWRKAAEKAGLRPVYGVELAVTRSIHAKKPAVDYWTFIAKDDVSKINELVELATSQFRYVPLLTVEQACAAEGVFKIIGHRSEIAEIVPAPDMFVALSPSVYRGYYEAAKAVGHAFIAASDNRYPLPGDRHHYEIICGRMASTQSYPQHILSPDEWRSAVAHLDGEAALDAAWANRQGIEAGSVASLPMGHLVVPERPATLLEMCKAGAKKLGCDITRPEYAARLERELKLIAEKDFEDYFYIIADLCTWSRERMLVGPARGSSCGSLVCYLLQITTIDPIPYGLIFERFIDVSRNDLPDIDIDFSDTKREMAFRYMEEKYGRERVARLGAVSVLKPKSVLKTAGMALDIPVWKIEPVVDSILDRSSGDARALQATEDTLKDTEAGRALLSSFPEIMHAVAIEGHPSHTTKHAAGIVITDKPVTQYVAIDANSNVVHCDKKDAEDLNLLKIDALGLTQLSIFEDTLELIGKGFDFLDTIPLDDAAAFDVLNNGYFAGIFQFNGLALQSIAEKVKITHLEDIISITALARPGPLNSGGTNQWIRIKRGEEPISYPHPLFEPYLKTTLGIVAYQEQVMEIGRQIGGLTWEDVTALRKAMSKSLGAEFFNQYGDRWKAGAREKGLPEAILDKVWDDLCAYGAWAFNRSHSVAYGIVSYYCCWFKAHYPLEFAAATLSHTEKFETQIKVLRDIRDEGVDYIPADIDISTKKWTVGNIDGKRTLVGPLTAVRGVGPKLCQQILSARARQEPVPPRAAKLFENPKTNISSLYPVSDRVKEIVPDLHAINIFSPVTNIKDVRLTGEEFEILIIGVLVMIKPRDENEDMNIAKRGYEIKDGKTAYLNLRIEDDTDIIIGKINRWDYERWAQPIIERGRQGKAIYALKGKCPPGFRMIQVKQVRYIGDMDDTYDPNKAQKAREDREEQEETEDDE